MIVLLILSLVISYALFAGCSSKQKDLKRVNKKVASQSDIERYTLEQENLELRLQLGMPPERRIYPADNTSKQSSADHTTSPHLTDLGYTASQAYLMAGLAAIALLDTQMRDNRKGGRDLKALKRRLQRKADAEEEL